MVRLLELLYSCSMTSRSVCSIPFKKLVIESRQAVYFEIPKVACTTINFLLVRKLIRPGEEFSVQQVHTDNDLPRVFGALDKRYDSYFKFSFVRHPLARIQSCFLDKIKPLGFEEPGQYENGLYIPFKQYGDLFRPGMNFDDFVASVYQIDDTNSDPHFRSQACFLLDPEGNLQVDHLGRFENFEAELKRLFQRFEVPDGSYQIPKINQQTRPESWDISLQTQTRIAERYRLDFERFGYEMEV